MLLSLLRNKCGFVAAALVPAFVLGNQPLLAAPATLSETRTYAMIGAMNICVLDSLDVDFDKALLSSSVAITRIIEDRHNSQFEGFEGSNELWSSEDDVRQAVAAQVSILVDYLCGEKMSDPNTKKLDRVLEVTKKLSSGMSQPGN